LKELEKFSGFSGSRLIEEVILAISDVMENFANIQAVTEEKNLSPGEAIVASSSFETAMETILSRLGYQPFYEEFLKDFKKASAKARQSTGKPSDGRIHSGKGEAKC